MVLQNKVIKKHEDLLCEMQIKCLIAIDKYCLLHMANKTLAVY